MLGQWNLQNAEIQSGEEAMYFTTVQLIIW